MQDIDRRRVRRALFFTAALLLATFVAGCSVDVKDNRQGEAKKVDIESPMGSIHVNTGVDIADTGLSAYPGARVVKKDSHENESANVRLEAPGGQGMQIVVLHYESDDAPDKIVGFYRDQLKKYGAVNECKGDIDYHGPDSHRTSECRPNNSGEISLAAQSGEDNQRIVNIRPKAKGSEFAVVYLRLHPEKGTI